MSSSEHNGMPPVFSAAQQRAFVKLLTEEIEFTSWLQNECCHGHVSYINDWEGISIRLWREKPGEDVGVSLNAQELGDYLTKDTQQALNDFYTKLIQHLAEECIVYLVGDPDEEDE